jgi:hypothetical protein
VLAARGLRSVVRLEANALEVIDSRKV